MIQALALLVGIVVGFVGSRALRRPQNAAAAAAVARNVSGSLGRRRGLTPPELQRACFSEMVRHVQVDRHGHTHAPARYVIHLHAEDMEMVDESRRWFDDGLRAAFTDAARAHGWTVDGKVEIGYESDPSRRPGVPAASAEWKSPPNVGPATSTAPARSKESQRSANVPGVVLVRSDTGERIPLTGGTLTVGRARDRDIVLHDSRVSREHLRFEHDGREWTVLDEGSANGTLVRNRKVTAHEPVQLKPGDVVSVGPIELRLEPGGSVHRREPGTRALDDSDRNRISREFLPPGNAS